MFAQGYSKKAHIHQGIPSPLMRLTTKPGIGRDGANLLRRRRKILRFEITKLLKLNEFRVKFSEYLCIWRDERFVGCWFSAYQPPSRQICLDWGGGGLELQLTC